MTTVNIPEVHPRAFRDVMSKFASGITIITGHDGSEPIGFTCQSFYSVSIEPMLISFSVMKTSTTYPRIREAGKFAVNVLAQDQSSLSEQFARSGTDKWASVIWQASRLGTPIIADTLTWVDCSIWAEYDVGDHWLVVGGVKDVCPADGRSGEPLLFFEKRYRRLREVDQA